MKKISCNIIRDILPLYLDDVVSDETKEMVEELSKRAAAVHSGAVDAAEDNMLCIVRC